MDDYRLGVYERHAEQIVNDLHGLAERIAREAKPYAGPGITGTGRYTAAAEAVQHALTWGIANLNAYRLIEDAHHADRAEAEADE
jgi:hypothetical protein